MTIAKESRNKPCNNIVSWIRWTEAVSFPEQTLGSETEVSQSLLQQYGTVCRPYSDLSFPVFKQHLKSYLFNAIVDRGA